jgi:hypothetical protein
MVGQPLEEMGRQAVRRLWTEFNGSVTPAVVIPLRAELRIPESTIGAENLSLTRSERRLFITRLAPLRCRWGTAFLPRELTSRSDLDERRTNETDQPTGGSRPVRHSHS